MANKFAAAVLLLLVAASAPAELLHLSRLKKKAPLFTVRRDIFNGDMGAADSRPGPGRPLPAAQAEAAQKTIAEEIAQSVSYDGFVVKGGTNSALLNISGEFYMVVEGDQILGKIRVLKISRSRVTIEYEGLPYEIMIKGDENG
ncbi:MAG TPA: hypothetical protein VLQ89_08200 [Candidatus Binatia bacterium]|nr:hypothetical protein [Candidatus Binatia bacterium]